jgi:two-component system CheB/CheR fusion protein
MATSHSSNVCIVGIGASAGGIESLKEFFDEVPADTGLAFVVIQHLNPNQPSHMAALLSRCTEMKVVQAEDHATITANHVYTIPPGKFIFTKDGQLHVNEPIRSDGLRMPIDFFFRSLAQDQGENAAVVLFSGSGSDGTLGIREIHGAAGLVIVQDPQTAQFDSMIQHALATGMVDYALPVRDIPAAVLRYVDQHRAAHSNPPDDKAMQDGVASIVNLLASQNKGDFRSYKPPTLQRRIQRRMGLHQINEVSDYYRFLTEQPAELTKLSQDMLIGVTSFFRDPEAFEDLHDKVIIPLVREANNADPLRAWIAGCATGEEAYSLVILLMEEMARARKSLRLQVFASDIDPEALKSAREGLYSASIAADLSEERLARFFVKQNGTYRVDKEVREAVTFASHNVILDPPFFNMDLISCRNLLIYIEPQMQQTILSRFAFALKPGRYLFLGKSENPMEQSDKFEPISKNLRIFRRNSSFAGPVINFARHGSARLVMPANAATRTRDPAINFSDLNQQVLLKHFRASIVLVDEKGEIRHFYGPTHRYLSHTSGKASLSLFEMIEIRHSPMFRVALEKADRDKTAVQLEALEFGKDEATESVDVTIVPIVASDSGTRLFAIIFEDTGGPSKGISADAPPSGIEGNTLARRLEAENRAIRGELQASSDAFQTMHEELTAANEEVMAINEELQSTNEELVTSKEELQSVNEELITTNSQLNEKVEELGKVNDDLANFLNSSEVCTIFLDRKFCVRRFTPSVTSLLNLLPLDLGRPISHTVSKFIDTDLVAIADNVLKTLIPVGKEVLSTDGRWHLLRCLPYRSSKDVIDGVVFTFTDITGLKHSEEAIIEARDYAENIIQTVRHALLVLDAELKVVSANQYFYETFRVVPEKTLSHNIYDLGDGQWNIPELRELLEVVIPQNSIVEDFVVEHDFLDIGRKLMSLNARRISSPAGEDPRWILLAISDVSQIDARARLAALVESSQDAIVGLSLEGIITSWNAGAERIFGYRADEIVGQSIMRIVRPGREEEEEKQILQRLRRGERVEHFETVRIGKDRRLIDVSLTISPIKDVKGTIIGASKVARDITERKRIEQQRQEISHELEKQVFDRTAELREANRALLEDMEERVKLEEQLRQSQRLESMGVLAAGVAHDLNNLLNIIRGYASILGPGATSQEIGESVEAITETTKRGAALVEQLLTLSRKAESKIASTNVNTLIQRMGELIKGTFPKNVEAGLDLFPELPAIMADANQITQVLLNLCVNARDAMPDGGKLTLKTWVISGKELEVRGELRSEDYVAIEVIDTGTGMDESVQRKIFEPFFTTKEIGHGTGLGLAVAYGIVKSHNGFIEVESQPMRGTTFRLYFPAVSSGG